MNTVIKAALVAWTAAQLTKILVGMIKYGFEDGRRAFWRLVWAGGMPSAHSALVAAVAAVMFHAYGPQNLLFGLSVVLGGVVVYDRGRMYSIYHTFQERYPELKQKVRNDPILRDLVGHRFSEILAGLALGLVAGIAVIYRL